MRLGLACAGCACPPGWPCCGARDGLAGGGISARGGGRERGGGRGTGCLSSRGRGGLGCGNLRAEAEAAVLGLGHLHRTRTAQPKQRGHAVKSSPCKGRPAAQHGRMQGWARQGRAGETRTTAPPWHCQDHLLHCLLNLLPGSPTRLLQPLCTQSTAGSSGPKHGPVRNRCHRSSGALHTFARLALRAQVLGVVQARAMRTTCVARPGHMAS